uniref:Uncharacterized protein n=1 Tax=Amphimedon queenslandica TaxID=400682 RepID=A0A1X7TUD7_AMPQE
MSHKNLVTELHETFTVSSPNSKEGGRPNRRHVIVTPGIPEHCQAQEAKLAEPQQFNGQVHVHVQSQVLPQGTPAAVVADPKNELSYLKPSGEETKQFDVSTKAVTGCLLKGFYYHNQPQVVCGAITEYSNKEAKTVYSLQDKRVYYDGYSIK